MLAKKVKMQSLKRQRDYLEIILKSEVTGPIENLGIKFIGVLYRENLEFLSQNGYDIQEIECHTEEGYVYTEYLITKQDVELTPEEVEQALEYDYKEYEEQERKELLEYIAKMQMLEEMYSGEFSEEDFSEEDDELEEDKSEEVVYVKLDKKASGKIS